MSRLQQPPNFPLVLKGIEKLTPKIIIAGERGLRRGLEYTRTLVQREYLSGPRPGKLDVRTTRLRQSIAIDVRSNYRGVVGTIGSNVRYAAFHEFGFRGLQQVRAHSRAISQTFGGKDATASYQDSIRSLRREIRDAGGILISRETRKRAAGRQRTGSVTVQFVRAHTRNVDYAGRPFIRPALVRARPIILDEIRKELAALKP